MLETGQSSSDSDLSVGESPIVEGPPIGSMPACEICGSTDVSDAVCIEHLPCGYTASITTFEFNNFMCPRCGRKLMKEQVDYRKVIIRVCHNCGHIAKIKEVTTSKRIERSVQIERELPPPINLNSWIDHADNTLRKLGLRYVRDYKVKGASGATHRWDFAVWLSEEEKPEIIIKFSLTNSSKPFLRPIDYISDVLSIAVKKVDSGIPHLILVMNYEKADYLSKTCEELDIKLVSAHRKKLFTETLEHLVKTIHGSKI